MRFSLVNLIGFYLIYCNSSIYSQSNLLNDPSDSFGFKYIVPEYSDSSREFDLASKGIEGGITKEQFDEIIQTHQEKYDESNIIQAYGASLTIKKLWDNNTKNAGASKKGSKWTIKMYGGLARHQPITPDSFALVLCHEMGHLLGGFPAYEKVDRISLLSSEGNSDFYATFVCAHFLWQSEVEINKKFRTTVEKPAKNLCDQIYSIVADQNLCYRKLTASKSLAYFLNEDKEVSFTNHDKNKVDANDNDHPDGQCRMDTLMSGSFCLKYKNWHHKKYPANSNEMVLQTCFGTYPDEPSKVIKKGYKPRCWFKP